MEFKKEGQKFACHGMQLTRPVDLLAESKYAILRNVRAYTDGTIHQRLGLSNTTTMGSGSGVAHSLKRYFDPTSSTTAEFVGRGTDLFRGTTSVASGFSGNPLSFVIARPFSSLEPYLYVSDTNKMVKVDKAGTVTNVGITAPVNPLSAALGGPSYSVLESFESAPNGWTNGGTAGAIALMAGKRVNTTITYILYDTGSTGWASISPAAVDVGIQPGAILQLAATEAVKVEKVFSPITTTTISSISYDSGSTGPCTIQLTSTPLEGLERDAIVRLAGAENVRILSVTTGPDGVPSFRCSTTATRSAGDAVAGLASFRAYLTTTRAAADTITGEAFETSVTVGIGYLTKVAAFNLSTVSNRPISSDDEIHISVRLDKVNQLTEGKIMFNVDSSTTFDKNYAYFPFTANSLTPAVKDTLTTRSVQQTIIQQQQINEGIDTSTIREVNTRQLMREYDSGSIPLVGDQGSGMIYGIDTPIGTSIAPPGETATGDSQWTELVFKVKDLTWVGADQSKNLSSVNAIRVQVNVTATTVCDFDSLWIGGTYGLDSTIFPYVWTYCYVNKGIGVRSNPAPPMRTGVVAKRNRVILTPSYSADAQVDQIEFYRYGGTLPEWHFVGVSPNSGTFTDTFADDEISNNFGLEEDNVQPFPVVDAPRSGTCDVKGTEVTRVSGDNFNTAWLRGSEIVIDGIPTSLYTNPSSTTRLSVEDSLGTKTSVTFYLKSPTLGGQTMTAMWGPYTIAGLNFSFGCKLGTLYFTKANNPDAAPESYQLEVTSPNEPLVGGCIYDGQSYVFSTERMFRIIPALSGDTIFEIQEVPIGKGLMAPWALTVDDRIYFLSRDGLYETNGQDVRNLTDADLYPLFPHDGQAGVTVNGVAPPDYTQTASLRLAAGDGLVKFTFKDTGAEYRTLMYDTRTKGWVLDTYTPTIVCHYWDEGGSSSSVSISTRERVGGSDGKVYTANSGTTDAAVAISSKVRTKSWDMGESRAQKLFGDLILDHVGTITVTPGVDNYSTTLTSSAPTQVTRGQSILDLTSGGGRLARNFAIDLTFTDPTVVLYEWQPSFIPRPEDTKLRWTDYTNAGSPQAKYLKGLLLTVDTQGVSRTVEVQGDAGTVIATLTVNHNGLLTKVYSWTPALTHQMRLVPTDASQWKIYDSSAWLYDLIPELSALVPDFAADGDISNKWLMGFELEADTVGSNVTLQLQGDSGTVLQTYTINHNGRIIKPYDLDIPAITHSMRLVPTSGILRDYQIKWYYVPYPEDWATTPPFENDGDSGSKFLQGFELEVDTNNLSVSFELQGDGGTVLQTYTAQHNGKITKPYTLTTPAFTHNMRLVPTSGTWRFFNVKWIWEAAPDLATTWESQGTSHLMQDFHHLRRAWVALISTDVVTLTITADGTSYVYTIPSTGGVYTKVLVPLQAVKAKLWKYRLTSAQPFRLYLNDSTVETHAWGAEGPYQDQRPFGAVHYYNGPAATQARI